MHLDRHTRQTFQMVLVMTLLALAFAIPVSAANHLEQIDIQAVVQDDGSLSVLQTWIGKFSDGTEIYIPLHLPSYAKICDFQVSDESTPFSVLNQWDVNASFAQKAQKCGVLKTEDGYELCFGIGAYGQRRFQVDYTLANVIGSYSDADGTSYLFVNKEMNTTPTNVTLEIRLADGTPITEKNCEVWSFGFEGSLQIQDGVIRAATTTPIQQENHVTIMFSFVKGVIHPKRVESESFESVKQTAGAPHSEKSEKTRSLLPILISALGLVFAILSTRFLLRWKKREALKKIERLAKEHGYVKDLPNDGNRQATYALAQLFQLCSQEDCLKMGLLRLANLGCLDTLVEDRIGFLGKAKGTLCVQMNNPAGKAVNELDQFLYGILERAAGAELVLHEEGLSEVATQYEASVKAYLDRCEEEGRRYLSEKKCMLGYEAKGSLRSLSESGRRELKEILGFRQYLQDFSRVAEQEKASSSWRVYLEYALLFGNADSFLKELKKVYPNQASELEQYHPSVTMAETFAHSFFKDRKTSDSKKGSE